MRYQHLTQRRRRAATLVEFAIVIALLLLFMFAIFEYGRFVMTKHMIDNAAREGARLAVANTNTLTTADIQNRVITYLGGQRLGALTIQVFKGDSSGSNIGNWFDAHFGDPIVVQIDCTYTPLLPSYGMLPNPVTLSTKATMRSEAN